MNTALEELNLAPPEASAYLKARWGIQHKPSTLAKLRCTRSDGPVFRKAGRSIIYTNKTLDEYAAELLSEPMRSTSDSGAAR